MANSISFDGRLGRDAELKSVGETQVLNFVVASDVGYGDKKKTNWFNCAIWGKRGSSLEQYLKKGQAVTCYGEFSSREYEGKNGKGISMEVRVNELTLQGGKSDAPASAPATANDGDDMPF